MYVCMHARTHACMDGWMDGFICMRMYLYRLHYTSDFDEGRTFESDPQTCQADRILRNLVHIPQRDDKTAWVRVLHGFEQL